MMVPQGISAMQMKTDDCLSFKALVGFYSHLLLTELPLTAAGYQLEYTTQDSPRSDPWVQLQIPSDHLSVRVESLTPHTPYFFRIAALGLHGPGMKSPIIAFTTPSV